MPNEPSPSCVRISTGNRTLLVVADSTQAEALHLPEVLYSALCHWGMPYRIVDLAKDPFDGRSLEGHAAVVIAQEHLGHLLTSSQVAAILKAVQGGLGLVNFDQDLKPYGAAYQEALGLTWVGPGGGTGVHGVENVVVTEAESFITSTRDVGDSESMRRPVPALIARVAAGKGCVLAESQNGVPVLMTTVLAAGRVTQWLMSPSVWVSSHFGHAQGLDDLFWKGIVWAARKPFVMKAMPPFVRFRFDDCEVLKSSDLYYVDVLNEYGHVPSISLCMRAVSGEGAARIKVLADAGKAEFAPHTIRPNVSLFYGDEGGEYSEEQFRALITEVKGLFEKWGVTPSPILSDHGHSWSWRVVPFLKEFGIEFKMNVTMPGERNEDPHVDWRPGPYGSMSYALDYLPEPLTRFFVVFNHYRTFDHSRVYLPDGHCTYLRRGFISHPWDFLNGLTTFNDQHTTNQLEAAARRLADHTRLGIDNLFFGGSITHWPYIRQLSSQEWRVLMDRYEQLTSRYQKINVGYDHVAHYSRSKVDSHLAHVEVEPSGKVRCRLEGRTSVPLLLYVFQNVHGGVEHRFEEVPVFENVQEVTFST